jgi:hypothetical protein
LVLKFPDSADSADLAAAGYSQVIILGGGSGGGGNVNSVSYDFWEPSDISSATLVGWFDGSDISANGSANTGSETQWTNKVSGQNNLSFNGTYLTIGNDYVRTFAGSYLQETGTASLHQANDWRVFIVGRLNGRSGSDIYGPIVSGVWASGGSDPGAYIYWKGDDDFASYGNYNNWTNVDGQNVNYRTLHSNTALFDFKASTTNGHVTTFDGGRASYSGGDATPAVPAGQLLTFGYQVLNTRRADVSYLDIVIIQGTLSSTEEEKLYGYLAHKAGIQGELPSSNAYQNTVLPPNTSTTTTTTQSSVGDSATVWTIPEGVDSFSIMAIGAGGAAGYSNSTSAGGGGGGGGLAYLNNIAVAQGDLSVQSISVAGGKLGIAGESDGGAATDLTVTMNLSSVPAVDLAGFNINPYGQIVHDSADSDAKGLLFVGSNKAITSNLFDSSPTLDLSFTDSGLSYASQILYQQPPGPFGEVGAPEVGNRLQLYQTIYNNSINSLLIAQNPYDVIHDSADSAASRPDFLGNRSGDSNELTALGQLDSDPVVGTGRLTFFTVVSNFIGTAVQATITNSPYLDSSGGTTIGPSDPNDYRGYGPGTDLEQVIIRSRPGDIIQASS